MSLRAESCRVFLQLLFLVETRWMAGVYHCIFLQRDFTLWTASLLQLVAQIGQQVRCLALSYYSVQHFRMACHASQLAALLAPTHTRPARYLIRASTAPLPT